MYYTKEHTIVISQSNVIAAAHLKLGHGEWHVWHLCRVQVQQPVAADAVHAHRAAAVGARVEAQPAHGAHRHKHLATLQSTTAAKESQCVVCTVIFRLKSWSSSYVFGA
jgi:hypothetical protein